MIIMFFMKWICVKVSSQLNCHILSEPEVFSFNDQTTQWREPHSYTILSKLTFEQSIVLESTNSEFYITYPLFFFFLETMLIRGHKTTVARRTCMCIWYKLACCWRIPGRWSLIFSLLYRCESSFILCTKSWNFIYLFFDLYQKNLPQHQPLPQVLKVSGKVDIVYDI